MTTSLDLALSVRQGKAAVAKAEFLLLIGLTALYVPTYISVASLLWNLEENAHGPIVLAVVLWLFWKNWQVITSPTAETEHQIFIGAIVFIVGLLLYIVGRSQEIWLFEIGSQIPVIIGLLLMFRGKTAVKALWFPIFFLFFTLPLPGFVVDAFTGPLKEYVSKIVEMLIYALGYPIGRNGVVLTIGNYQLLVADACSGLNSMFSLTAMGLLYLYLMQHRSPSRNILLIFAIWPIAFAANVGRVMVLVLVTYYLGDAAGQGFLHSFASVVLFVTALLLLIALDKFLGITLPNRPRLEVTA